MKNYKFKIKKIITNTVELQAENYKEALTYLLEVLEMWDKEIFENSEDKKIDYDIILEKIKSKNDIKSLKEIKKTLEKIEENTEEIIENNTIKKIKKMTKITKNIQKFYAKNVEIALNWIMTLCPNKQHKCIYTFVKYGDTPIPDRMRMKGEKN